MPLNRDAVLALTASSTVRWTARDAALYAVGVGLGRNPLDIEALRYVALEPLRTLPSMMASLIVGHGVSAKQMGVLFRGVVHAAQRIVVPRPLPANAVARTASSILGVYDQGAEKGAAIVTCTRLIDDETGVELGRAEGELLARADGGFGGPAPPRFEWPRPEGSADTTFEFYVRPEQAILFRLSGDTNPLHVDPRVAGAAGFAQPILQGLCTYGMACRAVQEMSGGWDGGMDLSARFSAPVLPGDRLVVSLWRRGGEILFEAHVPDRGAVVLKAGRARLIEAVAEQASG